MTESPDDTRRKFLIDNFDAHVDHIRVGQARRFEILRYSFAGFFAYFAFILSIEEKLFLCSFPFETLVLIPGFLCVLVFLYIWIVNWNIGKHGRYIAYLFDNGLNDMGIGPNLYQEFLQKQYYSRNRVAGLLNRWHLHSSQAILAVLILGCTVLYGYVMANGGIRQVVTCPV